MPVRTRSAQVIYDSDDGSSGDDTVMVDELKVFENMTMRDVLNNKRMTWTDKTRHTLIFYASVLQFSAHCKPSVAELYYVLGKIGFLTKNFKALELLVQKVLRFITNNINMAKVAPALYEVQISRGDWDCWWRTFTESWRLETVADELKKYSVEDWTVDITNYRKQPPKRPQLSDARLTSLVVNMHRQTVSDEERRHGKKGDSGEDSAGSTILDTAQIRNSGSFPSLSGAIVTLGPDVTRIPTSTSGSGTYNNRNAAPNSSKPNDRNATVNIESIDNDNTATNTGMRNNGRHATPNLAISDVRNTTPRLSTYDDGNITIQPGTSNALRKVVETIERVSNPSSNNEILAQDKSRRSRTPAHLDIRSQSVRLRSVSVSASGGAAQTQFARGAMPVSPDPTERAKSHDNELVQDGHRPLTPRGLDEDEFERLLAF